MVRLASSCAWNVPSSEVKKPCGSCVAASSRLMSAMSRVMLAEPSALASTTTRRLLFSRRIWLGPSPSLTSAMCRTGTQP